MRENLGHHTQGNRKRGFTLIELLIVIAIVALLAAILFPVFARVREGGRRTACASNLKQLGMAFQQYVQDNANRYPLAGNFQSWADGAHWVAGTQNYKNTEHGLASAAPDFEWDSTRTAQPEDGVLYQYVRSASVYVCPSTEDSSNKRLGYAMNCAVGGLKTSRMRAPSEIILLVDEGKSLNDGFFWAVNDTANNDDDDEMTKAHNGGGNLLMADYSAKFYPFEKFVLDGSAQGKTNKTRMEGSPRFHDRAFGSPNGSSLAGSDFDDNITESDLTSTPPLDSCAQPL